ncbi:hypothetical protein BB987_04285 [Photorhabdus temperata]|uniref:Uncharacterized protein n=1 Tax=Photorhabdus khanii NC19 TaxID=1004151 RepID=W3V991_9GAMM|nr:hypothetical protein [Photorhabdus khanii]ETS31675.1 hypothetical protein PTE_02363 [Photorhabdus khanii NC19]OHV58875.1 hypothetical protein BB987_04285 [Photorhabdus temperata]
MSEQTLDSSQVAAVEFDNQKNPRVIVTTNLVGQTAKKKYSIYWEDDSDPKANDHSLVVYNILLAAMSNQNLHISGKYESSSILGVDGMIKTLTIKA